MNATTICTNCGHEIIFAAQKAGGIIFSAWVFTNKYFSQPYKCDFVDGKLVLHTPEVAA